MKKKQSELDIYGLDERFSKFDERIRNSDLICENKDLVIAFKRKVYSASLMGKHRIHKYEVFFKNYDRLLQKPFNEATRDDLEEVVSKVKDNPEWKELTKRDFLLCLKRYYKIASDLQDESEYPELVKWIKTPKVKEPPINYDEIPSWDDVVKMANYTLNARDEALIKSIWEAGNRIGEHLTLRVCDVEEVETGLYLNIWKSKTDPRKVFIKLSAEDILCWLNMHPLRHDGDAPLFCKLKRGEHNTVIGHKYAYELMKRLKKRAKINKKVSPHMLRHGSASYFSDWLSDSDMDTKYGWRIGSKIKARYTHKNPKSVEAKIRKMAGEEENGVQNIYEEMQEELIRCLFCDKLNSPSRKTCWYCKHILKRELSDIVQLVKESMESKIDEIVLNAIEGKTSKRQTIK
ncbi:MAG: tyrosine-type recombinase/integrase [Candidatus Altiarchaeota archaeon]|nr:tyrosine-type recombinase/integrase [Candidatus Altiarchaeota archaeon]